MGNVTLRREQSTNMGGVPSSSLSVERLQGAEVVSAHLSISGGSRPAELFSDGYLRKHRDPRNSASSQPSSRFIALHHLRCRIIAFTLTRALSNRSRHAFLTRRIYRTSVLELFHR